MAISTQLGNCSLIILINLAMDYQLSTAKKKKKEDYSINNYVGCYNNFRSMPRVPIS